MGPPTRTLLIPASRLGRWFAGFEGRHGATHYAVLDGALLASAADGASVQARLPFGATYAGPPSADPFAAAVAAPPCWGLLLVRRGGFAVARLEDARIVQHKIGQRHVQGRTKAGGQSQQRFARRRDNQARAAFQAAADHAARVLGDDVGVLVTGGDRTAVAAVLRDPRLARLARRCDARWLDVPDPRRTVLDGAVDSAVAVEMRIWDP